MQHDLLLTVLSISEGGLQCIIAPFKNNSRGVAILFNNDIDFTIHRTIIDVNGNFISTDLTVEDKRFTLTNLYGPNTDDPYFYRKVFENIQDLGNESTVIVGDWNLVLDPSVDLENYKHINNPKAREEVLKYLEYFNLFDIWRDMNIKEKKYTWWKKNPRQQARLDFFIISQDMCDLTLDSNIFPG